MLIKGKKVLIVENDFQQFTMLRELLDADNEIFPGRESDENQDFITDVLSFLITSEDRKKLIGGLIKEQVTTALGGMPDIIFLDWSLEQGADNYTGSEFNQQFIKVEFPDAILIKISQYFAKFTEEVPGKEYSVPKFAKGNNPEKVKENLIESIKKISS